MQVKHLVGIDMSISSPGVSIFDVAKNTYQIFAYSNKQKSKIDLTVDNFHLIVEPQMQWKKMNISDFDRYLLIAERAFKFVQDLVDVKGTIVYFEGYAFAAKGKVFNIAEVTGMVKYLIRKYGWNFEVLAPAEWKKEIIGKGNAKKEEIYNKLYLDSPFQSVLKELESRGFPYKKGKFVEDICDSYSILQWIVQKSI